MMNPFSRLFLLFALLFSTAIASAASPDSLRTRWINGQKVRLHKVMPRETWIGVSEKYHVDMQVLLEANPGVKALKIGQIINIPLSDQSTAQDTPTESAAPATTAQSNTEPVPQTSDVSSKSSTYKVQPRDTWSGLARKFSTDMATLKAANPGVDGLKIGQRIRVPGGQDTSPSQTQVAREEVTAAPEAQTSTAQVHTVKKGETLYKISSQYGISVARIKELNKLAQNEIKVGQRLVVSEAGTTAQVNPVQETATSSTVQQTTTPVTPVVTKTPDPLNPDSLPKAYTNPGAGRSSTIEKDELTGAEIEKFEERGVVAWFADGETNKGKFYALHRAAPIGTIIKVTNRMNNNSVYVKVVGVLQETGDNENIICKITQAAAQRIGVIDQRFTADLSYGVTRTIVRSDDN